MKTLLRFLAIFSIALLPALSETAKERAHEAEAASQPPTDDSQKLAAEQIDKSISDLKEALAGLRDSLKKGDRKSLRHLSTRHGSWRSSAATGGSKLGWLGA